MRGGEVLRFAHFVKITISEFGEEYLEYAKANKRSWLQDEQIMKHLRAFGNMLLTDMGPLPIERYKLERMQVVAPATVNREIALLKRLFNVAKQWGMYRGCNPVGYYDTARLICRTLSRLRSIPECGWVTF